MMSFDATSREVCTVRRIRTNTPLQALVTLNDTVYLDIARHFAHRLDSLVSGGPEQKIAAGYRRMLYKEIAPEKLAILMGLYRESLQRFMRASGDAGQVLGDSVGMAKGSMREGGGAGRGADGTGVGANDTRVDGNETGVGANDTGMGARRTAEQAALVVVCNALLNLDEVITKN
jgi:hypothetical protein